MAHTENVPVRKNRIRLFQVLILAAVLGLVWYGFGRYVLAPVQSSSVPDYVGSLKIASRVEGAEALADINKLHGTNIALQKAFIADYRAEYGGEHLMVWVGEAASESAAIDLINQMVKGIQRGGSGFSNPRQVTTAGRSIWQSDGRGGQFFFYISGSSASRVVWLTIEGKNIAPILESAVKTF